MTRFSVVLTLIGLPVTHAGLHGQSWIDRTQRVTLNASSYPHGGRYGGPAMLHFQRLLGWDGVGWQDVGELPAGVIIVNAMTFDAQRQETVAIMQTGMEWSTAATWVFDGTTWTVRASVPTLRITALIPDLASGGLLAFGDDDGTRTTQDQLWNGSSWTPLPANVRPYGLRGIVAPAPTRSRVVVVGIAFSAFAGQTWEWDGRAWTQRQPTASPPVRQWSATLGEDPVTGQLLLCGGRTPTGQPLNDTWSWDGVAWRLLNPATVPPLSNQTFVGLDPSRRRLVLFDLDSGATRDWVWTGTDWQFIREAVPVSQWSQYANDPLRGVLVRLVDDRTFEWDGRRWSSFAGGPPPRHSTMAFDISSLNCLLFGGMARSMSGVLNDTWSWDGRTWTQHPLQAVAPLPRNRHAMVASLSSAGVILFGGTTTVTSTPLADTWLWSNGRWTELTTTLAVSPPSGASMGASGALLANRPIVLAGNQIWSWTGGWNLIDSNLPPLSYQALGQLDNGTPVLVGLRTPGAAMETHELHGGSWVQQGPPPFYVDAMAVDPLRGSLVGFDRGNEFVYTGAPARASVSGRGCGAPTPGILGATAPQIGSPNFRIVGLVEPAAPTLFAMDLAPAAIPLGSGCLLLLAAPVTAGFAVANAVGFAALPAPVPFAPSLRGLTAFAQVATLQAGGPLGGVAVSPALRIVVGD